MSPFSHHGLPVGGKEWMQQGGHHEKNGTRGMGLENERSCDMGVHLRASPCDAHCSLVHVHLL